MRMLYFIDVPLQSDPNWLLVGTEMLSGLLISLFGIRLWTQLTPMISYLCAFGTSSFIFFEIKHLDRELSSGVIFGASVIVGILCILASFANSRIATIGMLQLTTTFLLHLVLSLTNSAASSSLRLILSMIVLAAASQLSLLLVMGREEKRNCIANVGLTSFVGSLLVVFSSSWLVAAYDSDSRPWKLAVQQQPMPSPTLGMVLTLLFGLLFFCISGTLQYYFFVKHMSALENNSIKNNKDTI